MMSLNFRPCGHCSACAVGMKQDCVFPVYQMPEGAERTFSNIPSSALGVGGTIPLAKSLPKNDLLSKSYTGKCAHTHPPFVIPVAGSEQKITLYGGGAHDPVKKDCDVYVSLSGDRPSGVNKKPWRGVVPTIFSFRVPDYGVPSDAVDYKKMIAWLKDAALSGKSIHIGCHGGHGRTGTLLAALTKEIGGIEDAITYVREHYCKRAVESPKQIEFLANEFGIKKVEYSKPASKVYNDEDWDIEGALVSRRKSRRYKYVSWDDVAIPVEPGKDEGNIWGHVDFA